MNNYVQEFATEELKIQSLARITTAPRSRYLAKLGFFYADDEIKTFFCRCHGGNFDEIFDNVTFHMRNCCGISPIIGRFQAPRLPQRRYAGNDYGQQHLRDALRQLDLNSSSTFSVDRQESSPPPPPPLPPRNPIITTTTTTRDPNEEYRGTMMSEALANGRIGEEHRRTAHDLCENKCPICWEPRVYAYLTGVCGHVTCGDCLSKYRDTVHTSSRMMIPCPICMTPCGILPMRLFL